MKISRAVSGTCQNSLKASTAALSFQLKYRPHSQLCVSHMARITAFSASDALSASERERATTCSSRSRSEEHTSELQSLTNLVCRLLLEKKKTIAALSILDIADTGSYSMIHEQ